MKTERPCLDSLAKVNLWFTELDIRPIIDCDICGYTEDYKDEQMKSGVHITIHSKEYCASHSPSDTYNSLTWEQLDTICDGERHDI